MVKLCCRRQMGVVKQRDSNIELLRVVAMLMIILHHYCLNSGIQELIDVKHLTSNAVLLQLMSVGGKLGINIFFLISGYYLVNSKFKIQHIIKLLAEVIFYTLLVAIFLHVIGYRYTIREYLQMIPVLFGVNDFVPVYLLLYLIFPYINRLVNIISKKEYSLLLAVLLFYFVIEQSVFNQNTWNYFGWGITVYMIGAYIRRFEIEKKSLHYGIFTIMSFGVLWGGILIFDLLHIDNSHINWYYFIVDSNKLTMIVPAVCLFLFFSKLHINYSFLINELAACSFGVFLLHTANSTLRSWLWGDLLHVKEFFDSEILVVHALVSICLVYAVGSIIDVLRRKFLEPKVISFLMTKFINGYV